MTKLPTEQVRIGKGISAKKPERGGPCARPGCDYLATDLHHLVRRSFLAGPYEYVEIDGVPRPNIVGLCWLCHQEITQNKAQILWDDQWVWSKDGEPFAPLDRGLGLESLPPLESEASVEQGISEATEAVASVSLSERESVPVEGKARNKPVGNQARSEDQSRSESDKPGSGPALSPPDPGSTCPTCDRRVPHKRTEAAPKTTKQLNLGHAPSDVVPRLRERLDDFALSAGLTEKAYHRVKALDLLLIIAGNLSAEALENYAAHVDEELGWAA